MKKFTKKLVIVAIVQLILHGVWEYVQCGIFYTMEGQSSFEHTELMVSATIGDVNIALVLFLLLSFVNNDKNWLMKRWERKDIVISILYALFVSFFFEVHALYNNRWGYSIDMPLFPATNIGLLPVIQLLVLLPLGFIIARYLLKRVFSN
ncbi:hypothetical protein [Orenia marismortui]|uniref:Uncharacterized protein n=1 Tax=Orenia marismortui TaxID=46469 RepID=A0A4R8H920_9FIRM|nr:hypothetical protein [Orenia marismortui]TDX51431.1 hypothetical protein C7959_11376 [Orenia marismortui]